MTAGGGREDQTGPDPDRREHPPSPAGAGTGTDRDGQEAPACRCGDDPGNLGEDRTGDTAYHGQSAAWNPGSAGYDL